MIERGAEAVDVGPRVHSPRVFGLLWGHVIRGSHYLPRLRELTEWFWTTSKTKIRHACLTARIDQDVRRFEITMNHTLIGCRIHPLAHLSHPGQCRLFLQAASLTPHGLQQVLAFNPIHAEHRGPVRKNVEIVDRHDIR